MRRSTRVYPFLNSQGTRLELIANLFVVSLARVRVSQLYPMSCQDDFVRSGRDMLAISPCFSFSLARARIHRANTNTRVNKRASDLTGEQIETRVRTCYQRVNAIWDLAQFVAECVSRGLSTVTNAASAAARFSTEISASLALVYRDNKR